MARWFLGVSNHDQQMCGAEIIKYIEQKEKELGITPDPRLVEMARRMQNEKKNDNIMVVVM